VRCSSFSIFSVVGCDLSSIGKIKEGERGNRKLKRNTKDYCPIILSENR